MAGASPPAPPSAFPSADSQLDGSAYSHHRGPNSKTPDEQWGPGCYNRRNAPCVETAAAWGLLDIAARSNHTGGVNALMGDGPVRFVRDTVSLPIWQAAASIDGGEVLPGEW